MNKRRLKRVAVMILSIAMLLSSTGIMSSLAANVSESSSAPSSAVSEPVSSTSVAQEGGAVAKDDVTAEGGVIAAEEKGNGTAENPYQISGAEDFLRMNSKINTTSNANKYFVLTSDIDLSAVNEENFRKNGGSLVSINKKLAKTSENVFFHLDGKGHKLKGLNVSVKNSSLVSIFGTINAKSSVKNVIVEKPQIISTSEKLISASAFAYENKGTISGVQVISPVITVSKSSSAAFIASVNEGTVSRVTVSGSQPNTKSATAESHTVSAFGVVGAIAAVNRGTIVSSSAINIGMFIPASETVNTVYGGIAGRNSGTVSDCVSTGNVCGGKSADAAGGIVGKAESGMKLSNCYTLVAVSATGCAVAGTGGSADTIKDCYWSSSVSKKTVSAGSFGAKEYNLNTGSFKVLPAGKTVKITKEDAKNTAWGKAVFALDGKFTSKNSNISADGEEMTVTSGKVDTVNSISYTAKISLPASVGSGAAVKQNMKIYILNVPENAKGDGTKENPLEIKNPAEFGFIGYASNLNVRFASNISSTGTYNFFMGSIDGSGYTLRAKAQVIKTFCGEMKNLNVSVNADISTALFGTVIGASLSNIGVTFKSGVKFNADKSNTGILANRIIDKSVFDDCRVKGTVAVASDKLVNIGGFAGVAAGSDSRFTNSGAVVSLSLDSENKIKTAANFIGLVSGENNSFENCYVGGANKAGTSMFIGTIGAKSVSVKNVYVDYSSDKAAASAPVHSSAYKSLVDKAQFREWKFDIGNSGFFTGNSSVFDTTLPAVKAVQNSSAADFTVSCDKNLLTSSVSVDGGKALVSVKRVKGVVTVKAAPVVITNKKTGLTAEIYVSNGLEKDSKGNWIVSNGFDLVYISENIADISKDSFVMNSDIDMSGLSGFAPIGSTAVAFSGTFDGCGHKISNLSIDGTAKTALFGTLSDAEVKNIVFTNASVKSEGSYAAVVAGQATGKTTVSGITAEKVSVTAGDSYSAVIVGSVDNASAVKLSDITVKNASVKSTAGYVGAAAGHITDNTEISGVTVDGFTASGSDYISGIAGLAEGESAISISNVKVNASDISGVSEISGIASGIGKGVSIKNAEVKDSVLYTAASASPFTAGGISAVYGSSMENVRVDGVKISAGFAGGIVGKTGGEAALTIKNAEVTASEIISDEANTVAAGILAVHNVRGSAEISDSRVSDDTVISGAAVTAGIAGDCSGAESVLAIKETKSFADVNGCETANAISAAGVLGRIGTSSVSNVTVDGVTVGGSVSGNGILGGIIGLIKNGEPYNGKTPLVSGSVAFAQLEASDSQTQTGMIIGGVESKNVLTSDMLNKAISNVIISTYYGSVSAYPAESGLTGGRVTDMDKPNGKPVAVSESLLSSYDEVDVAISNLPKIDGFVFDSETGWVSESDDRIQVVSCTENTAVLKAHHMADLSVVAYYVLDSDSQVRVPVHFAVSSSTRNPLKGSGTMADPYIIGNAYDLETVAQYSGDNAYFALAQDIVFTAEDFEFGGAFYNVGNGCITIGDAASGFRGTFTGLYNGKVHSITGLSLAGNNFGGLFGAVDGAVISDIIINDADVSGLNYAGVIAGSARNTTIKNITINSAKVEAVEFGGYAGSVVGYAENTTVENVAVNGAEVKTNLDATSATIEIAGGVAGVFDGTVKNVVLDGVTVESGAVAGGIIGSVRGAKTAVADAQIKADITSDISGGVIGCAENLLKLSISGCAVGGTVEGTEIAAGIVGKIISDSTNSSVDKAQSSIISDTVVSAVISEADCCGVIIAEVSDKVICDSENRNVNVFSDIYYSSYRNSMGLFGNDKIESYQNAEYTATDLSDIRYVADGEEKTAVEMTAEPVVLTEASIKLNGVKGSYKSFAAADRAYTLETIKSDPAGAVEYDPETASVKLSADTEEPVKLVFVYNDGLEIAIDAVKTGGETEIPTEEDTEPEEDNTVKVSYTVADKTGGALKNKVIGINVKSRDGKNSYSVDTFTKAGAESKAYEVSTDNGLYVSAELPQGIRYSVKAVDENGKALGVTDEFNEGFRIENDTAKSVVITITAEKENSIIWGLRSVWNALVK